MFNFQFFLQRSSKIENQNSCYQTENERQIFRTKSQFKFVTEAFALSSYCRYKILVAVVYNFRRQMASAVRAVHTTPVSIVSLTQFKWRRNDVCIFENTSFFLFQTNKTRGFNTNKVKYIFFIQYICRFPPAFWSKLDSNSVQHVRDFIHVVP